MDLKKKWVLGLTVVGAFMLNACTSSEYDPLEEPVSLDTDTVDESDMVDATLDDSGIGNDSSTMSDDDISPYDDDGSFSEDIDSSLDDEAMKNEENIESYGSDDAIDLTEEDTSDSYSTLSIQDKTVRFAFDSARLSQAGKDALYNIAQELNANPNSKVAIHGHTDHVGSKSYNFDLGNRRAEVVRDYLLTLGVGEGQLEASSMGETQPVAHGGNKASRAINRRAAFQLE